jgi:hypothetical protein
LVIVSLLEEYLAGESEGPVITVEVQLSPAVKLIVSGRDLEEVRSVLAKGVESAGEILALLERARPAAPTGERRIPQGALSEGEGYE